jgi:hypothetical protein
MTSSGDSGGNPMALLSGGTPMPGLPIAGSNPTGDPYKYGQFQNFLPDVQADGQNPSATGLRPEMFDYKKPGGGTAGDTLGGGGGGGSGDIAGQIQGLRDQLAKMQMGGGGGGQPATGYNPFDNTSPGWSTGGMTPGSSGAYGGVGTMGLGAGGGGFGPPSNGLAPPPGATQLPTPPGGWGPGNVPGWPQGGPGTPIVRPGVNTDPAAAAAAAGKG